MNQTPEQQIHQLGKKLGLDLMMDEQQQVLLLIDGNHPVSLRFNEGRWRFYGIIQYLDEQLYTREDYQRFLTLNLHELQYGVGGICLDESARLLVYIGGSAADELYDSLDEFVRRIDALRLVMEQHVLQS